MPHPRTLVRRVGSPTIKNGCPCGDASRRCSAWVVGGGISPRVVLVGALGTGPREEGHTPGECIGGARGGEWSRLPGLVNPWVAITRWSGGRERALGLGVRSSS